MTKPAHDRATGPAILQVLPALGSGGVERGTVEVAGAIVKAGGRAFVISTGGPLVHDLERAGAVHVIMPVASKNPFVMWRNAARLARFIIDNGISLVHARSRAPAWSCLWACRRMHVPLVTTVHAAYKAEGNLKRAYNSVMTKGARVIAISQFIAHYIQENYAVDPDIIRIIPRGVDLAKFNPDSVSAERMVGLSRKWELPDDRQIIFMPSRLTRIKGHEVLLKALAKLKRRDFCCVMVGGGDTRSAYLREIQQLVEKLGLAGKIYIVDHCSDMPAAYQMSSVVVMPSLVPEGFGRNPVEAQAMGRPVIATGIGGCAETVIGGETGWLVPPDDADALADALTEVLALDAAGREKLAGAAMAHVRENYSIDRMLDGTLAVYEELIR